MFVDLNVPWPEAGQNAPELKKTLEMLQSFGYDFVAYNHVVPNAKTSFKPNPIKIDSAQTNTKPSTETLSPLISNAQLDAQPLRQLTRLTIIADDQNSNYQLNNTNPVLNSYDILAIRPTTERLFQQACQTFDVDIISLDMGSRLPFYMKGPTVNLAISRGIHFEICYAPAIRDQTARKHLITNAAALIRLTKGKNVIITSEAQRAMEVRGPYDVINLGSIFSLNQALAKNCITINLTSNVATPQQHDDKHIKASCPQKL
ncbi:Ribonuclease P protein subunit p30 [Rhizophlyctis rosea]|uniref:Ribonuclease P protein subunit p30 n=1 Tax=Rhizophlyctis rosea TaxID=64517 RepID=A0AAD5SI19_9FUNG|nr:Ribonuclease P protein subunit p30 [Rhizophlyctis rosea]